jgi:glycosyltransferase involved in cell wall biosynthesis
MIARGVSAHRISTVLNGTIGSCRTEAGTRDPSITLQHPAVLTVAGMYARKGIADLIEAAAILHERIPGVRVYVAGDGPERGRFEALASERGLSETVVFLGFREDAQAIMPQADVFVLASHAEPCSLVLCEARANHLPIVATNVGGNGELLEGGLRGCLVPPHDPAALAAAIGALLTDEEARKRLGRATSENLDILRVDRMAKDMVELYRRLVRRGHEE